MICICIPIDTTAYTAALTAYGVAAVLESFGADVTIRATGYALFVDADGARPQRGDPLPALDDTAAGSVIAALGAAHAYADARTRWQASDPAAVLATLASWRGLDDLPRPQARILQDNVAALQVLHPHGGKGSNSTKPDGVNPTRMTRFWLAEYCTYVGFVLAAIPRFVATSADVRVYVPLPGDTLAWHDARAWLVANAARLYSGTHRRMDMYALLILAEYPGWRGMASSGYRSLGKARIGGDVTHYQIMPVLHDPVVRRDLFRIVTALRDEHRHDAAQLLNLLRDLVADPDGARLGAFQATYGRWQMQHAGPQLTTRTLHALVQAAR